MIAFEPSLSLSALTPASADEKKLAWASWLRLYHDGINHIPYYFVLDLTRVVMHGDEAPFLGSSGGEPDEIEIDETKRRYATDFMGRILLTSWAEPLRDLLQVLPDAAAAPAVHRAIELTCGRLARFWPVIPPPDSESIRLAHPANFEAGKDDSRSESDRLAVFLDTVAPTDAVHHLIQKQDFFTLARAHILGDAYVRRAVDEIMEIADRLEQGVTGLRIHTATGAIPDEDEGSWRPQGGFNGLSFKGSPESLLPSEFAYHDPESDIDLMDIRMLEGEALYLNRDTSVRFHPLHRVDIVVPHFHALTYQVPPHRWRISNLIHGLAVGLIRISRNHVPDSSLKVRLHVNAPKNVFEPVEAPRASRSDLADEIAKDMELLRIVLANEVLGGDCVISGDADLPGESEDLPAGRRLLVLCPEWMRERHSLQYWKRFEALSYARKLLVLLCVHDSRIDEENSWDAVLRIGISSDESVIEAGRFIMKELWAPLRK